MFPKPRYIIVFILGFSSGLPLALTAGTLQAWYAKSGIDIVTIGMLSLVGQPYLFKFLWAPFMDRFFPPILGRRRGWMLVTQICLMLTIAMMALFNPQQNTLLLAGIAIVVAFFSASQDIAIDAYRTDILTAEERGPGIAFTVAGYRLAMIVSASLALIMADYVGWRTTYLCMAGLMSIGILSTFFSEMTPDDARVPSTIKQAVIEPLREYLSRPNAMAIIVFIILYKLGDAFTSSSGSLVQVFLLNGLGFSLTTVGTVNKAFGLIAMMLGFFIAGPIIPRIGHYRALLYFGLLQAVSNLSFMLLAMIGPNIYGLVAAVFLDNLCGGLGTAACIALLMSLCHHRYTATQYALFSSIAASTRVIFGPLAGILIQHIGWMQFFWWTFIVALPALLLLVWLRDPISDLNKEDTGLLTHAA